MDMERCARRGVTWHTHTMHMCTSLAHGGPLEKEKLLIGDLGLVLICTTRRADHMEQLVESMSEHG